MTEKVSYIPSRLKNAAVGGHVAGVDDIYDDTMGKTQQEINNDVDEHFALHQSLINALDSQNYVTVETFAGLPATGAADTIYRVSNYNGSVPEVDSTKYSEYAWNGTQYVLLSVKSAVDEVFDISVFNAENGVPKPYETLSAALGNNGANVPAARRKGGMSIKFIQTTPAKYTVVKTEGATEQPTGTEIQSDPGISSGTYTASGLSAFDALPATLNSSLTYYLAVTNTVDEQEVTTYTTWVITYTHSYDNKYVQFRYMGTAVTGSPNPFFDTDNWQGVDLNPTPCSKNLAESGGIAVSDALLNANASEVDGANILKSLMKQCYITDNGKLVAHNSNLLICKIVGDEGTGISISDSEQVVTIEQLSWYSGVPDFVNGSNFIERNTSKTIPEGAKYVVLQVSANMNSEYIRMFQGNQITEDVIVIKSIFGYSGLSMGEYLWNGTNLYEATRPTTSSSSQLLERRLSADKIYKYEDGLFVYNGETLISIDVKQMLIIKAFGPDYSSVSSIISKGDYFYHTVNKKLYFAKANNPSSSGYVEIPLYIDTVYFYYNEIYKWDGSSLILTDICDNARKVPAIQATISEVYTVLPKGKAEQQVEFTSGNYRRKDNGAPKSSGTSSMSALIEIDKSKKYYLTTTVYGVTAAGVCYYKDDESFISSDCYKTDTEANQQTFENYNLSIPSNAKYFAFSKYNSKGFSLQYEVLVNIASQNGLETSYANLLRQHKADRFDIKLLEREMYLRQEFALSGRDGVWYGVEWIEGQSNTPVTRIGNDMTLHSSLPLQSKMRRCIVKNGVVQYYLDSDNSLYKEDGVTLANLDGTDGDFMVEIPECFYQVSTETNNGQRTVRIKLSEDAIDGFFYSPKQYVSAVETTINRDNGALAAVVSTIFNVADSEIKVESGTYIEDANGTSLGVHKLATISGYKDNAATFRGGVNNDAYDSVTDTSDTDYSKNQLGRPVGNMNRAEFRSAADKADGFLYQYTAHQILWLFATIEYATLELQQDINNTLTIDGYKQGGLGMGACSYPDYTAYEAFFQPQGGLPSVPCGTTACLGNNSGEVYFKQINVPVASTGSGSTIEYTRFANVYWRCNSYRGVEHVFGDAHKVVDNINMIVTLVSGTDNNRIGKVKYFFQKNPYYCHDDNNNANYESLGEFSYQTAIKCVSSILASNKAITLPINTSGTSYNNVKYCDANEYKDMNNNVHYIALGGRFSSGYLSGFLFHYGDYSNVTSNRKATFTTRLCYI